MKNVKIGLETHVQLDTSSKLFCSCENAKGGDPNSRVCPICLGHPGSKPQLNQAVMESAAEVSRALNCEINQEFRFARKNYFYPDLSKSFQITQFDNPVGVEGSVEIKTGDDETKIGVRRIHIEEDPAKIEHSGSGPEDSDYTLVDYNRAGTPLLEIVTEPDLKSPEEARQYLKKLGELLEYLGLWNPDSGFVMKSDANISLEGGERVEVKNITGTKGIQKALSYEISRQKQLSKRGKEVEKQTRSYDANQEITTPLREKEDESDYGYIIEPDLTRQTMSTEEISQLERKMPELPDEKRERLKSEYGISNEMVESITTSQDLADVFESLSEDFNPEMVSRWITKDLMKVLNYNDLSYSGSFLEEKHLRTILELLDEDRITDRNAEKVLRDTVENSRDPSKILEEKDLLKKETDDLKSEIKSVVASNPEAVKDYNSGETEALNFLVGQVMQETGGRVDPKEARDIVKMVIEDQG